MCYNSLTVYFKSIIKGRKMAYRLVFTADEKKGVQVANDPAYLASLM